MAGIKEEKKIYLVGIYCRLSKDDGTEIHPHGLCEKAGMAHSKNVCGRWLFWYKFPKTKFPEYDKRH